MLVTSTMPLRMQINLDRAFPSQKVGTIVTNGMAYCRFQLLRHLIFLWFCMITA